MKKRLLAIILTICLLGTVIIDNVGWMSTVEASDESPTETSMPTSSHTFKDFGVTEGTYKTDDKGNQFNGDITKLLDGGMLTEIIKINKRGTGNYFMVLFADTASSWAGLQMQITSDGKLQFGVSSHLYDTKKEFYLHISPSEVGLTSFIGSEFELGLAFQKADTDNR